MHSIKQVQNAFFTFHYWVRQPLFGKGSQFEFKRESDLLPLVRFFLLGAFDLTVPEYRTKVTANPGGKGYFDFFIPGVAIELAVRAPHEGKSKLTAYTNRDERRKLATRSKHWTIKGGALVLLDFSNSPLTNDLLEEYRSTQYLRVGEEPLRNFSVLYYFTDGPDENSWCVRKNIAF